MLQSVVNGVIKVSLFIKILHIEHYSVESICMGSLEVSSPPSHPSSLLHTSSSLSLSV